MSGRAFRIASLIAPPVLAAWLSEGRGTQLVTAAAPALLATWFVMACALGVRWIEARYPIGTERQSPWRQIDLLTGTGAVMMWLGAGALIAASRLGWASLSVIGILGMGVVQLAAAWTAIAAAGRGPWRRIELVRTIVPAIATEGDPVREEIELAGMKIPAGMRLFAIGRAFRHGPVSRYAIDGAASGSKLRLASELGPAPRGDHQVPALSVWLADILGLTRTPAVELGQATCCVMPRPSALEGAELLKGQGGDAMHTLPTQKMPTEGTFRIREYRPGDDTRRIHWVRSLQQDQLVVRLPDEIPIADPEVRLVLDTELLGAEWLTCRAVDELLDAMVRVWLGIARELDAAGARVTLVCAAAKGGAIAQIEQAFRGRTSSDALRLGARATWQADLSLATLLGKDAGRTGRQIVVSCVPRRLCANERISWVAVPEIAWTSTEPALPSASTLKLPFPSGSADNRRDRQLREHKRIEAMWHDRALFTQITSCANWSACSGDYVAKPDGQGISLAVIP